MGTLYQNNELISGGSHKASSQKYDNTSSGLDATTVQGAIDEVNSSLIKYDAEQDCLIVKSNGVVVGTIHCGFQFDGRLYVLGEQFTTHTGGWTDYPKPWASDYTSKNASFTTTGIEMACNENSKSTQVYPRNKINLSGWNNLNVEFTQTISNNGSPTVSVKPTNDSYISDSSSRLAYGSAPSGATSIVVDVSQVNSEAYIVLEVDNLRSVVINKVYLTK